MFYVVVDKVGFCYIPTVTVTDQKGLDSFDAEVRALTKITKSTVNELLDTDEPQAIETDTLEAAVDLAEAIYKKLPRYRRQIDFDITTPDAPTIERYGMTLQGAGTLTEEISEKYL